MSKKVLWIWLGTLVIGVAMMLAGCGGRAPETDREAQSGASDSSSKEVTVATTARYDDEFDEQAQLTRQIDRAAVIAFADQHAETEPNGAQDPTPGELLSASPTDQASPQPPQDGLAEKERKRIDRFRAIPTTLVREPAEREIELSLPAGNEIEIVKPDDTDYTSFISNPEDLGLDTQFFKSSFVESNIGTKSIYFKCSFMVQKNRIRRRS